MLKILAVATVLLTSSPEKIGPQIPPGFGDTEIKIVTFEIGGTDDLEFFFSLLILHLNQEYGMIEGGAGGAKRHFQLGEVSFYNKNLVAAAKHLDESLAALQTSPRIHLAKLEKREGIGGVYSPRGGPPLVGIRDDLNPVTNRALARLGILDQCMGEPQPENLRTCPLSQFCRHSEENPKAPRREQKKSNASNRQDAMAPRKAKPSKT